MRIIKEITMTIKQQEWIDAYNQALKANVDLLHKTKQIPGNAEVFTQYSQQIASEMFNKGMTPEDAANYAAMSLVRRPLLDEIQKLTIKRRMTTDPAEQSKLDERISLDQQKYNKIMGMKCFEAAQTAKPLTEGVELPNMICWGRGYGENSNPMDTSVIARFNSLAARNDPYTGGINPVLARTQQFEFNNASKYSVDPNPELDKYVDTVFVDDMGPEAFTVNGENPYRVLDKIRAGEEVNIPVSHGVAVKPSLPSLTSEPPKEDPGYVDTFDSLFSPVN